MTPEAFLEFATGLANSPSSGAAAYRSSTSRAYYGVYHAVRGVIENDLKISLKSPGVGGENFHLLVQQYLQNCNVDEAGEVGRQLGNLHDSRKEADYDLHLLETESQVNAQACIARAEAILEKLKKCTTGATRQKVIAGMTQYRKLRQGIR